MFCRKLLRNEKTNNLIMKQLNNITRQSYQPSRTQEWYRNNSQNYRVYAIREPQPERVNIGLEKLNSPIVEVILVLDIFRLFRPQNVLIAPLSHRKIVLSFWSTSRDISYVCCSWRNSLLLSIRFLGSSLKPISAVISKNIYDF